MTLKDTVACLHVGWDLAKDVVQSRLYTAFFKFYSGIPVVSDINEISIRRDINTSPLCSISKKGLPCSSVPVWALRRSYRLGKE